MLHNIWVRHHLRPGEFWKLPRGEQLFLLASMEIELEKKEVPSDGRTRVLPPKPRRRISR